MPAAVVMTVAAYLLDRWAQTRPVALRRLQRAAQDVTDALAALVIVQQRLSRRKPHRKG